MNPANGPAVALAGFILAVVGTAATLVGLYLTFKQARKAASAAQTAKEAVNNFRFRADRHDAFRDLSQASYALDMTRRHLDNSSWTDAADSYEDARRAIIRVQLSTPDLDDSDKKSLTDMAHHMANFCDAVDAAKAGKRKLPDAAKVTATIRRNHDTLAAMQRLLQNGANDV